MKDTAFAQAAQQGFTTGQPAWSLVGLASLRLSGWCYQHFQTLDLFYEVNGRAPNARCLPPQLRQLGELLAQHAVTVADSDAMAGWRAEMTAALRQRQADRAAWWQRTGRTAQTRNLYDLLQLGY